MATNKQFFRYNSPIRLIMKCVKDAPGDLKLWQGFHPESRKTFPNTLLGAVLRQKSIVKKILVTKKSNFEPKIGKDINYQKQPL